MRGSAAWDAEMTLLASRWQAAMLYSSAVAAYWPSAWAYFSRSTASGTIWFASMTACTHAQPHLAMRTFFTATTSGSGQVML